MAEIRVQPRKSNHRWVWLVLLLLAVAAVVYYLYLNGSLTLGASASDARAWVASAASTLALTPSGGPHGSA